MQEPERHLLGTDVRWPHLEGRIVGGHRGHVGIPEVAGHRLAVLEADGGQAAGVGQGRPDLLTLGPVPGQEAGVEQEDIARLPFDAGGQPGPFELGHGDGSGADRIEPVARPTELGVDVEEDGPAGDATVGPEVDGVPGPGGDVLHRGAVVVAITVVAHVGQRVPLAGGLGEVVVELVVEARPAEGDHGVLDRSPPEQRGVQLVQSGVEAEHLAGTDQAGGGRHPGGGLQVEQPDRVLRAEQPPP